MTVHECLWFRRELLERNVYIMYRFKSSKELDPAFNLKSWRSYNSFRTWLAFSLQVVGSWLDFYSWLMPAKYSNCSWPPMHINCLLSLMKGASTFAHDYSYKLLLSLGYYLKLKTAAILFLLEFKDSLILMPPPHTTHSGSQPLWMPPSTIYKWTYTGSQKDSFSTLQTELYFTHIMWPVEMISFW